MQPTTKPIILVVDDEPDVRKLLRMTLGSEQATILEATDGEEAVAMAQSTRPDLIVLDVLLPTLGGYEVCERLKADPATANSHVIILTTATGKDDPPLAEMRGADQFVTKPFSPLHLLRLVNDAIHLT